MALNRGDVIELPEDAYKYGQGTLRLRVTGIRRDLMIHYEYKWVWVRGVKINWNGQELDEITVLVKVAALPGGSADPDPGPRVTR